MEIKTMEYTPDLGELPLTEEMIRELKGKSIEEQLDYFSVGDSDYIEKYSYGESDGSSTGGKIVPLLEKMWALTPIVKTIIVHDGMIVGAVFHMNGGSIGRPTLLNQSACTYFSVDDDGTGSTEASSYSTMIYTGKKSK